MPKVAAPPGGAVPMPTYEYVCESCKHGWELEQRMVDDPVKKCPKCKKLKAQRVIAGASNFVLKGGGWYSDLYSSTPKSKSSGDSGSAKSESSAAPAKKSGGSD
jgi:putative FmdB family regulatory protein